MAISAAVTNSYKQEVMQGIHLAADTYKIALFTSAATLGASTTTYDGTNEVANGNGYATGGADLAGFTAGLAGSTAYIDFNPDPSWSGASFTARGALIYNSSKANKAVAVIDFGADYTSTNGNFTVQLPAAGATAIVRIA